MARALLMPRLGAIAALTAIVLVYIGQYVWPQAVVGLDGSITGVFLYLRNLGWAGFLLVQVLIAISGFVPASLVGVSAGAAYGVTLGFAAASISTLTGAIIAFLLSRSLLRPLIERRLRDMPKLSGLDGNIRTRGWRLVCLLRLSPVMPFAATSYALGLSSIAPAEYLVGTLASLPSLLAYVLAGALVRTGASAWSDGANFARLALLAIGTVATVVLMMQVARMVRHAVLATVQPNRLA
jgi:uncharacterized membrane protein YdjX (TVP38/TMEM64 family)